MTGRVKGNSPAWVKGNSPAWVKGNSPALGVPQSFCCCCCCESILDGNAHVGIKF